MIASKDLLINLSLFLLSKVKGASKEEARETHEYTAIQTQTKQEQYSTVADYQKDLQNRQKVKKTNR